MVHFQQQSAHVHKTEYMNFPCDASSSSPLSIWALSCTRRIIDWHSLEEEPVHGSPRAHKVTGDRYSSAAETGPSKKISACKTKQCSFFPNSHLGVSVCKARRRSALKLGVSSAAAAYNAEQCHSAHYFKSREYYFTRLGTAL